MTNVFDITAFGAVGDGVTDCTAAIQTALDRAGEVCGCVTVPPGTGTESSFSLNQMLPTPAAFTCIGSNSSRSSSHPLLFILFPPLSFEKPNSGRQYRNQKKPPERFRFFLCSRRNHFQRG